MHVKASERDGESLTSSGGERHVTRAGVPPLGGDLGVFWNLAAKDEVTKDWRVKMGVSKAFRLY